MSLISKTLQGLALAVLEIAFHDMNEPHSKMVPLMVPRLRFGDPKVWIPPLHNFLSFVGPICGHTRHPHGSPFKNNLVWFRKRDLFFLSYDQWLLFAGEQWIYM